MRHFFTTILILIPGLILAQFSSTLGRFEVDVIKGCAPLDITITNLLGANCPCDVRFGDGNSGQNTFSHTYNTPGIYTLEIDYQSLNPRTDQIVIEVVDNVPPDFEILKCSGNRATIQLNDSNFDQYSIDFDNDGIAENIVNQGNPIPPHSYPVSGNHTIAVKGINLIAADNCTSNTMVVSALPILPIPEITSIDLVDAETITLGYNPQPNIVNRLEIATNGTSGFQLLTTLDNTATTFSINSPSINTFDNFYCFRIGSYDACDNTSTYSEVVCTVKLDLEIQDSQNQLNWNPGTAVTNHTICRNGACTITVVNNSHLDIDIECEQDYCYRIISNYTNGATSTSHEFCGKSFSTTIPTPINDLVTEVNVGRINLVWNEPIDFTPEVYSLYRGKVNESTELLTTFAQGPYADMVEGEMGSLCYRINYRDICGNSSQSPDAVCTMSLVGTNQLDNSIQLSWNAYSGYSLGVSHYRVEKYNELGFLIETIITTDTEILDDADITIFQVVRYKVFAIPNDNSLDESYSNEVTIIRKSNITHPQAFTPNGDGLNDEFIFYGTYVKSFRLNIFNRWGELIFSSNSIQEGWDGMFNGELLPSGSFSYSAEITDLANRSYKLSGSFALIRN